jgi:hypothetical protein
MMDVEVEEELCPVLLVGKRVDGQEEEVGMIGPELIKQSGMLQSARSLDRKEERIVVDVLPELLHLLIRFAKLVVLHNNNNNNNTTVKKGTDQKGVDHILLPVRSLPPEFNFQNRVAHLPYIVGFDTKLGEFLDILAERPYVVLQCAQTAERLLWEPAQTAMWLKFGTILRGLSLPFIELIWPPSTSSSSSAPTASSSTASPSSSTASQQEEYKLALAAAVARTTKFFPPPTEPKTTDKKDQKHSVANPPANNSTAAVKAKSKSRPTMASIAKTSPTVPAFYSHPTNLDSAIADLARWHTYVNAPS